MNEPIPPVYQQVFEAASIRDAATAVKELIEAVLAKGLVVTVFGVPITIQFGK